MHIGNFRMTNYGAALDRAGNPIDERTLCRNRNSGWVGREPLATAIPVGREYLYLTPTPAPAVRRPSGAWNTPEPVGLATVQAPVTRISGRTPVPTAADPTARARFRQQAGRGFGPAPTRQSGGADASRLSVDDGFPLDVSRVRGGRSGSVLQYRLWRYGGYAPPAYLVPFADVTGNRIPAPAVADASGWWAVQFRWRNPPVGDDTEATFSGLSEARVFWVWGNRSLTYWRQGTAAGPGLAGVPAGTAVPTPALAVGDRLVGRLDRYTLNGAAKQNGKHSYDSALLHLTGGAPIDGNIEYRVWPFGGFGPGPEYDLWWPLGAGGSRYVEIPGAGLYAGTPKSVSKKAGFRAKRRSISRLIAICTHAALLAGSAS